MGNKTMTIACHAPQPLKVAGKTVGGPVDGPQSGSADFYTALAHDLFAIGMSHRVNAQAFNRALGACNGHKSTELQLALSVVRETARQMMTLTEYAAAKIDREIYGNSDFPLVYGDKK